MHKLLVLYPHPADPEHFENHYRTVHLPLASKLPGVLSARFSLQINAGEAPGPYFAIFEAEFENGQALQDAMASEWGRKVSEDVPNYASGGAVVLNYDVEPLASAEPTEKAGA